MSDRVLNVFSWLIFTASHYDRTFTVCMLLKRKRYFLEAKSVAEVT